MVKVNTVLTKSRNPTEHGLSLEDEIGTIVHRLPHDPYVLIRFDQFKVLKKIKQDYKTRWIMAGIEWYVHMEDFKPLK